MDHPARRRVTLLDALILVAGTAAGLAPIAAGRPYLVDRPLAESPPRQVARDLLWRVQVVGTSLLIGWSFAAVAAGCLASRTTRRRSRPGPGFVASVVGSCWVIFRSAIACLRQSIGRSAPRPWSIDPTGISMSLHAISFEVGPVVASCWLTLRLADAWSPRPDAADRFGRAVGVAWLAVYLLATARSLI